MKHLLRFLVMLSTQNRNIGNPLKMLFRTSDVTSVMYPVPMTKNYFWLGLVNATFRFSKNTVDLWKISI